MNFDIIPVIVHHLLPNLVDVLVIEHLGIIIILLGHWWEEFLESFTFDSLPANICLLDFSKFTALSYFGNSSEKKLKRNISASMFNSKISVLHMLLFIFLYQNILSGQFLTFSSA